MIAPENMAAALPVHGIGSIAPIILLVVVCLGLTIYSIHLMARQMTWRQLYLDEQRKRTELETQVTDMDELLSDYAQALKSRDDMLVRGLQGARLRLMADTCALTRQAGTQ